MRVFLVEDEMSARSVLPALVSMIGGLELVGTVRGGRDAIGWLDAHPPADWDLAIVDLEQDSRQLDIVSYARVVQPAGKIVVFSSVASADIRSECVRRGADRAFHKMRAGDFAAWIDQEARHAARASGSRLSRTLARAGWPTTGW